jgi:hypothetical protein
LYEASGVVVDKGSKPMGGNRHSLLKADGDWLLARIGAAPDLPLQGIRRELAARNVHFGHDLAAARPYGLESGGNRDGFETLVATG